MTLDVILFTSPKAGSGAAREQLPRLAGLLAAAGIQCQTMSCPQTLHAVATQRRETGVSQPVVVAAGGDGTISLVAASTFPETPLLPMPMGTENLLARHLGQSNDAEAVMKTLTAGRAVNLDAGEANGRLFLIMATAGFDAEVVRRLHLRRKGHIRRHSYLKPIWQTCRTYRFPAIRVTAIDASGKIIQERRVGWAMAFNLPCYAAGLRIHPAATGDDGNLDLITFAGRGLLSGLGYVLGIVTGLHRRFAGVQENHVLSLRLESDQRVAYELDGDYAGRLPLEIKTLPQRIRLLVPSS
ncbi:Diacylglycerol kinase [Stieleria neptunia]|uniref:Diacylglycerol kinase n=1 Tax=Stieleria neptunia TaxID=2527979 RepID=A0A518HXY9_9BACT|nr:diacylglycerol kinase family protein [Stieleria neptunia]QDV45730.1 Diacylglycerol kinase [Stieleria neptunia]